MFEIILTFILYYHDALFYLIKLLVMFFNGGFISHPDFDPKTLLLTAILSSIQVSLPSFGLGVVGLTVLQFPGLIKWCEDTAALL